MNFFQADDFTAADVILDTYLQYTMTDPPDKKLLHLWESVPNDWAFSRRCFAMDMRQIEKEFDIASKNIMISITMKPTEARIRNFLLRVYGTGDHLFGGVLDMAEAKVAMISSDPYIVKLLKLEIEVQK